MDNGASSYSRYLVGDDSALGDIVREYKDGLTIYLNSFTNNIHDAEELMEETFFKLAYKKPKYTGKSSFKTWLFSIGKNKALMFLRKQRRMPMADEAVPEETADPGETPELQIISDERNRQVYKALGQLNEEYRQILILLYFENMSHEEAGKVMGKNRRQIYHLAERGRTALRDKLERMGFDDAQHG